MVAEGRLAALVLAMAAAGASPAAAAIDCSQFTTVVRSWRAKSDVTVDAGPFRHLHLPANRLVRPREYQKHGVDLYDLIGAACG